MVKVTQEDREAAVTFQQNWSPFLSAGPLSALIAQTREAALIKGIRMGLEAAAREADAHAEDAWNIADREGQNSACASGRNHGARAVGKAIRALDPNTIAKDAGHE